MNPFKKTLSIRGMVATLLAASLIPSALHAGDREPRVLVVLIGGMDSDPSSGQMDGTARRGTGNSGLFQLQRDFIEDRIDTEYFNWNGTRAGQIKQKSPPHAAAICNVVRTRLQTWPQDRVVIVGNSWGGHTACDVCRQLYDCDAPLCISHLVLLDPSSTGRKWTKGSKLAPNVVSATNYFTRNAFVWGPLCRKGEMNGDNPLRIFDVDLGNPDNGYLGKQGPKYDSPLSFPAHVAAEWDPRIHADIHRRVLDVRP